MVIRSKFSHILVTKFSLCSVQNLKSSRKYKILSHVFKKLIRVPYTLKYVFEHEILSFFTNSQRLVKLATKIYVQ